MADEKQDKKPAKASKGGGKDKKAAAAPREHQGVGLPVPDARLRVHYQKVVRAALTKQFGLKNPHQIPTLEKIVLNVGLGEAIKQPKLLDSVVEELGIITGQRPVRKKAKKSMVRLLMMKKKTEALKAAPRTRQGLLLVISTPPKSTIAR